MMCVNFLRHLEDLSELSVALCRNCSLLSQRQYPQCALMKRLRQEVMLRVPAVRIAFAIGHAALHDCSCALLRI